MKELLTHIRQDILMPNAYLGTLLSTPAQQIRVRQSYEQLFPEGVPQLFPFVLLSIAKEAPEPNYPQIFRPSFFVDVYSAKSYEECADLWRNISASVLQQYGTAQGIYPLLQGQVFDFTDINIYKTWLSSGPLWKYDEQTRMFFITAEFSSYVSANGLFNYSFS